MRGLGAGLSGITALCVTLIVVGDVHAPHFSGLPYSPTITLWLLPILRLLSDLSGFVMVGAFLTSTFLLSRASSKLSDESLKIAEIAGYSAFAYALSNIFLVIFAVSDVLGISPVAALNMNVMTSYVTQLTGGRVSLFQVISALLISFLAPRIRSSMSSFFLFLSALVSAAAPALTGHSGLSADHEIAASSLAVHIMVLSVWIGGLFILTMMVKQAPPDFAETIARFSRIALGAYLAVIASGAVNAWVRLRTFGNLFGSDYGRLILTKVVLVLGLTYFAWLHRKRGIGLIRAGQSSYFYRVAAVEVAIMFTIVGVAVTLSRTAFPAQVSSIGVKPTAAELLYGYQLPPAPNFITLLSQVRIDALWLTFALILLSIYLTSFRRLRQAEIEWSRLRVLSFVIGTVLMIYATSGGLGSYSHVLFSAHMVQHILLLLIIPELLVTGQPFRLALQAHSLRDFRTPSLAKDFLESPAVKRLSGLPVVVGLFVSSFYFLYFTPIFPAWMPSHWGHVSMEIIIFLIGYLFIWNVFGSDLMPTMHSSWSRFMALLVSEPFHIVFSVLLIWSGRTLAADFYSSLDRPYGSDLHHDQVIGGILGWLLGEMPMFLAGALLIRSLAKATSTKLRSA